MATKFYQLFSGSDHVVEIFYQLFSSYEHMVENFYHVGEVFYQAVKCFYEEELPAFPLFSFNWQ